jgi:hypothetical protein
MKGSVVTIRPAKKPLSLKSRLRRTPEALKVRLVSEARQTFGTPSAAQLWMQLGLPTVPAMMQPPRQGDLFRQTPGAIN